MGNLAATSRHVCPTWATLPQFSDTFAQLGQPCRNFPTRLPNLGNLAAISRHVCPTWATLPQFLRQIEFLNF
jgi:hypothetical protein